MKKVVIMILFTLFFANPLLSQNEKSVNIAMAQIFCLDGDRSGNFVRIENAIKEAKGKKADIVCFPETAILGWVNPDAHQRAYPIPGQDSDRLCKLATKYNVFLCIGLAEKEGERLYDSVILIDNQGKILLKHRKQNILSHLMTPAYVPGTDVDIVQTPFGKIGLLICADTFKRKILTEMKALGPDFVLVPYGWAKEEEDWPEHGDELVKTVRNAAKSLGCPVIGTDLVGEISKGPWAGRVYGGASVASDKNGNILGQCKDRDREVLVIAIKLYD